MPIYEVAAPDGKILEIEAPEGATNEQVAAYAQMMYRPEKIKQDTGFTGAFSAGKERLKGDIALLAGKTGLMSLEDAERYKREKDVLAEKMFKPTEEGWTQAPFLKFRETLGGSVPYMVAPLAAGVGAKALGVGAGVGLAGAGLASLGQFTGSNLARQIETGKSLEEASLGKAAAAAAPQTALDLVSLRMIPAIGKLFGAAGKEVTPELAKKIAEQGMLRTTAAYGAGSAKLVGIEGATEVGQQFLERLQAGLNLTDQQARDEYFDSFIGGAVLGGTLAVPGTYLERGATVSKGRQMEEEQKQQAVLDRQKAQQEAALAERQRIQETQQKLGVPETLALPAPDKKYVEPSEDDPLFNPLGRFKTTDLSAKEIAEINQRRQAMGKARIGKTFSIEDLADVFTPEETKTAEGVLGRLVASRTGFQAGDDISPATLNLAAQQRGISPDTQGFRDFLERTTGTNSLENMSPPQRLAVKQALDNIPEGAESQVLQAGITTVKHYTPEQYTQTIGGINKEFAEVGDKPNGRESVLKQIEKYSGLTRRKDQQRLLDQAILNGDLERVIEVRNVNGVEKNVEMIQKPTPRKELPGGMDIRKETFKQGETADLYEIRSGSRVINQKETAEEAEEELAIHERNRQAEVIRLEKEIARLQAGVQRREAELLNARSLGQDDTNEFFIKSANYYGQDQVANQSIATLRQQQQQFAQPIQIVPVGTRALTQNKFTYYEKGKPTVKFDSEEQAEAYGISRLNDQTLQQIIDSAPSQKQTGRVKRYVDLAQKELDSRTGKKPEGIEISTKKGKEGATERLKELGIYTKEARDSLDDFKKTLMPTLKRFGLEKVGLRIVNSIEDGKADGYYVQNLITLALDAKDVMGTLRHESIHAIKELGGFTDAEWKVLTNKAKSEWIQKFITDRGLFKRYQDQYKQDYGNLKGFDEYIQEEAIAEAFRFYSKNKLPAGMIGNIIYRIQKFFEALRNSLNKLGFTTANEIFSKVEEGGIKTLEPVKKGEAVKYDKTRRIDMDFKQVTERIPELQEGMAKLEAGEITAKQYDKLVNKYKTIMPYDFVPKPATRAEAIGAIEDKETYGVPSKTLKNGHPVGLRLDIPAYSRYGVWVPTIHEQASGFGAGKKIGHESVAAVTNATFGMSEKAAASIAGGKPKGTIATIKGSYKKISEKEAVARAEEALNDPTWTQVGMDPERHSYFYDRKTTEPVVSADEVIQIGPLVLAKNAVYAPKSQFKYSLRTDKKEITPLSVEQAIIYDNELEGLIKKIGNRIVGMKSEETLEDVKKAVKKLQSYTAQGLKGKDWYERSAKAVLSAFNNDAVLAEKFFQVIAITSANTEVAANFTKAANAWTQFAEGRPIKIGTENENKKIDALLNFGEEWEGRKTNTFYSNLMEAMDGKDSGRSTIDLHMTRMIFGKDVPTDAQYELAENMVRLLASKLDVAPRQIQAASWVTQKAKTMFEDYRAKGWKKDLSDEELSQFAFERAVADYSHQMQKRVSELPITEALLEPSKEIKTRVQNITGEVIPSVQSEMAQAEELNFNYKEKLTKEIANANTVQSIAKYIGVQSKIRVTVGSGAYAKKVNPNLIVQIINDDADVAEKDALDMANAMSYVFKQDATPFFRADPKLIDTDQIGFKLKFDTAMLTPAQQKKILAIFQKKFGNDAGFTRIRSNELVIINYRGENGKPFLVPDEEFMQGLADIRDAISEVSPIESQEMFGAKSEYPYHDWKEEPSGVGIVAGIQNRRPEQSDIQRGLDDFRESFVGSVRETIRQSGKEPKFSLRAEEVAPESKYSLALGNVDPTTFLVSEKNPNNTGNLAFMPGSAPFAKYPIRLPVGTHDDISDQGYGANHILRRMQTDVKRRPAEVTKERLEDLILHIEDLGKRFKRVYRSGPQLVLYDPLTDDAMFVKQLADHYEVQSMYSDARIPTKYGNAAWSGKNVQPPEAKKFEEKQRGILVQASKEGRVEPKPVGVKVKRVLTPNQIEAEAERKPIKGTLSIKKRSLRAPDAWYYSQLERGIESTPDRIFVRAPQIKAWLTSNAAKMGVKSEELQFSGINDWLDLKGNEKVSKQEILNYLKEGGVRLEEVNRSEDKNETRYEDYVLGGGTNYRELLITLPTKLPDGWRVNELDMTNKSFEVRPFEVYDGDELIGMGYSRQDAIDDAFERTNTRRPAEFRSTHFQAPNILAHVRMNDRKDREGKKVLFIEEIQSDWHQAGRKKGYEEPLPQNLNPNDLLWEYGPKLSPSQKNDLRDFIERYELSGITQVIDEGLVPKTMQQELMDVARKSLDDEYKAWLKGKTTETGIPSAPFKDTKAWTGLALKRIISYAAENGYDKVAFINGEQSADRYNIRDKIDNIVYEKTDSNTYDVDALKDGRTIYAKDDISLDEVEETFGKEIAEKIKNGVDSSLTKEQAKEKIDEAISTWEEKAKRGELGVYENGEIQKYVELMRDDPGAYSGTLRDVSGLTLDIFDKYQGRGYRNKKELSGLDLKVGGEGMINYYDKILPQVASDVLRKIGGGNLEKVTVPVRTMVSGDVDFTYSVVSDLTNNNAYVQDKNRNAVTEPMEYDDAKAWLYSHDPATSNPQTGFSITEKIREKVSAGIPLFSLRAPDSFEVDAFMNRIEGDSKIVNEDGTPKIMYHGTARDITEFKPKQANAIFLSPTAKFADNFTDTSEYYMVKELKQKLSSEELQKFAKEADKRAKKSGDLPEEEMMNVLREQLPSRANIIPVYVYANNPFDYANPEHIAKIEPYVPYDAYAKPDELNKVSYGDWKTIESDQIQQGIKDAGFDAFYVKEGGVKNLAVYDSSQIKSAFNVAPTKESKDIRYSFNAPPETHTKLESANTAGKRLTDSINSIYKMFKDPEERIKTRIAFIDPNSGLARSLQNQEIYTNGVLRADLLARAKAQTINLIRNGLQTGIPVVNSDGSVIIEIDEVNNLANSQVLADRLNDNYYVKGSGLSGRGFVAEVARALRGKEIMEEDRIHNAKTGEKRNREKQVTQAQIDWAEQQLKNVPEMQEIFDIWKKVNTGLINLWESVGLFGKAEADTYRAKKFYVSLAASNTDLETMMESQLGFTAAGLKSTPKVQKLEGAEYLRDKSGKVMLDEEGNPIPLQRNIWENIDKQYASMLAGAYQNQVRKVAVGQLIDAEAAKVVKPNAVGINLRYKDPTNPLADSKGVVHVVVDNATDLAAFESMHYELGPVLKFFGGATNILRAGALLNPMFWIRQLIRDPIHASIVANSGIVTPFHSAKEYINVLRKNSEEAKILASRGVIGQYDSTLDLHTFLEQVGTEKVDQGNVQKMFHKLMQMHEASDAATRVAIFKKEKQSALDRGMTDEEATNFAVMKAREAINFLVHGNSKILNAARQMIPFLSASITSLDTVYRSATGYNLPASEKEAARKLFKQRAALMFGSSVAYAMLMQDDEEYQKQPNYVKDNNWLIKNPIGEGFLKVPVPYEVGFLFKVVPEVALRYAYGNDTGKEMIKAYKDGLLHNLPTGGVPVPQAIKPALETVVNYSFFTGNPVESIGESRFPVEMRGRNASETAKFLSGAGLGFVGLSPSKIDNLVQGYFAEAGTFMFTLADELVYTLNGKEAAAKNLEKQPFFKAFMTDPNADKAVANFYDIQQTANRTAQGFNELKNSGRLDEAREMVEDEEKKMLIASAPTLRKFSENMTKIRRQIEIVKGDQSKTPEERRELVNKLTAQYNIIAQQGVKAANTLGIR